MMWRSTNLAVSQPESIKQKSNKTTFQGKNSYRFLQFENDNLDILVSPNYWD